MDADNNEVKQKNIGDEVKREIDRLREEMEKVRQDMVERGKEEGLKLETMDTEIVNIKLE